MHYHKLLPVFIFFLTLALLGGGSFAVTVSTIEDLDEASLFHFSIMSDNKGDGPEAGNLRKWSEWDKGSEFCLGLGDNLQSRGEPFIDFIKDDPHWREHFYPNIGDGENQHYSGDQGDWGSGWEMFNTWEGTPYHFYDREGVTFRPLSSKGNDELVDYRFDFEKEGFTVTTFSLHMSDSYDGGMDPAIGGMSHVTHEWLSEELTKIKTDGKDDKHIVVVLAHTDDQQNWVHAMPQDLQDLIIETADVAVGASTHRYGWIERYQSYNDGNGVVMYNSGSCGHAPSTEGYVELHVLDGPPRLVIHYIDTENSSRELHEGQYSNFGSNADDHKGTPIIKTINGPYEEVDWSNIPIEEPVGTIPGKTYTHLFQDDDLTVSPDISAAGRTVGFFTSEQARVTLSLYDSEGRFVKTIYRSISDVGSNAVTFDTAPYKAGLYYLQANAGENRLVKKFLMVR